MPLCTYIDHSHFKGKTSVSIPFTIVKIQFVLFAHLIHVATVMYSKVEIIVCTCVYLKMKYVSSDTQYFYSFY